MAWRQLRAQRGFACFPSHGIVVQGSDPVMVLTKIRTWLEQNSRIKDKAGNDVVLTFSSEVIDNDTFDLEVDFSQRDKVVLKEQGYHICSEPVWSDELGRFILPEKAKG